MSFEYFVRNALEEQGATMSDLLFDLADGEPTAMDFIEELRNEFVDKYPNEEDRYDGA